MAAAAAAAELAGGGPSPPADEGVVPVIMMAEARSCLTAAPLLLELVDRSATEPCLLSVVPNLGS